MADTRPHECIQLKEGPVTEKALLDGGKGIYIWKIVGQYVRQIGFKTKTKTLTVTFWTGPT